MTSHDAAMRTAARQWVRRMTESILSVELSRRLDRCRRTPYVLVMTRRHLAGLAALWLVIGAAPLTAQEKSGVFLGRVTDSLGTPVPNAAIALLGTGLQTVADQNGRFQFPAVPVGSHAVVARAIGWKPQLFMIRMEEGQEQTFQIGLERAPQFLPDLIAKGTVLEKPPEYAFTSRYDGFFHRRRVRFGTFRVRNQSPWFESASHTADLLQGIPSVRVSSSGPITTVAFLGCRGPSAKVAVWIDGSRVMTDDHNYALDYVSPAEIELIEVYRRAGQIPAEFLSDACAAIVIWTR